MALAIRLTLVHGLIFLLTIFKVKSIPVSPCPTYFHYEYNGREWLGVVEIYPQIYNRFQEKIRMSVTLAMNQIMPNLQNYRLLQLYKPLEETYKDIAERQPIKYSINFPFQYDLPNLIQIHVNGVSVCRNRMLFTMKSEMQQQYTIFLQPIFDSGEEDEDIEYDMEDSFDSKDIPKVLMEKSKTDEMSQKPTQCGTYDEELKYTQLISGGEKIAPGTWPWLVAIFRKDSKASNIAFQCTGSLISNRLVLTAAHCFKSNWHLDAISPKKIMLVFGRHDIRDWAEENMVISDVEEIILHPDFLSKRESTIFDADIAILLTKKYINYTSMIRSICLWPMTTVDAKNSVIGTNGTLIGWGQPFENIDENVPRRLTLPIVQNQFCFPSEKPKRARRVFCAGTVKRNNAPCNGDSGSGFAIYARDRWFVRGIVSAALGDPILNSCDLNTYTIFTDIVHFRNWIDRFMKI